MIKKHKIDMRIPGWNMRDILEYLASHVSELPNDAQILEIGAFFGRTTYVLGHNKPNTATLTTIDPWMPYHMHENLHDNRCSSEYKDLLDSHTSRPSNRISGDDFFKLWKHFTNGIENLNVVREYSPVTNRDWPMFDFNYHDASHNKEDVYRDLCFWFPKLKPNAVLIMDDYYRSQFPGLCEAVDTFVSENDLSTRMVDHRNIEIKRKV